MNSNTLINKSKHYSAAKEKISTAHRRWKLLSSALNRSKEPMIDLQDGISVRRFTTFNLVKATILPSVTADSESTWWNYSCVLENAFFSVQVCKINKSLTANDLIGFNNTGNVCVWPSEECLAYYLLGNQRLCRNKTVLELGGGMSCLAGVFAAKYCSPSGVTLTDGNVTSVDNVRCIIARNNMTEFVNCDVVQWSRAAIALRHVTNRIGMQALNPSGFNESQRSDLPYEVILCADCLFFDEARLDLVQTIYGWLADDGVALIMAPKRGMTFQKFVDVAIEMGFSARQIERYDPIIWDGHLKLLENGHQYCADIHYPVLLELRKQKKSN